MNVHFPLRPLVSIATVCALAGLASSAVTPLRAAETPTSSSAMNHVSGTLHFGSQKAKVTHLYFRQSKNDDGPVVALMFSSVPLPLRTLEDHQKLLQLARKGEFVGLYAELTTEGTLQQSQLFHADGAFSGPWKFEPARGAAANREGRIATDESGDFFGKPFAVDVRFKTAVPASNAWAGSPFFEPPPSGLTAGRAEGWCDRAGKRTDLTHAVMLVKTNLFTPAGDRRILLTNQPVTDEMLAVPAGPERALQAAGAALMSIRLDRTGEIQGITVPSEDGRAMMFSSNQWELTLSPAAGGAVEGAIESMGENRPGSEHPSFKIRFHAVTKNVGAPAPVTAENGRPLPADGGEPGACYHAFVQAVKTARTVEELVPYRAAALAGELEAMPAAQRARLLEFLRAQTERPLKIVGGFGNDGQATLWLEGRQDGDRMAGRVNVHRENGRWKLGAESYRSGNVSDN